MSLLDVFQRHLTTSALKIAGGIELSSTSSFRTIQHGQITPAFTNKITKAFLDAIYAFLDGLVHLTSSEWSVSPETCGPGQQMQLLSRPFDLNDTVSMMYHEDFDCLRVDQDTRLLLMLSNFMYLSGTLIPNMISQLESVFGVPKEEDRNVCFSRCHMAERRMTTAIV